MFFHKPITKNKGFEIQLSNLGKSSHWFSLVFEWTRQRDHAGIRFELGVLGLFFFVGIHDYRHWNHKLKRWEEKESFMLYDE